jgi:dipeptidyl aminopeptidase/acylaminoacyl peptidase
VSAQAVPAKQDVSFRAGDGVVLTGTFYPAPRSGPGILLSHMCDGHGREAWTPLAERLAGAGFHVFTWNYRGVGDSGGDPFRGGGLQAALNHWRTQWSGDIEAAFDTLLAQPGVDRRTIGAGGASCGVYLSLLLAERRPLAVRSLLLLAGPIDADRRTFVERSPQLPVFAAATEEDARGAAWMREIAAASKHARTTIAVYKGAGHGTQMLVNTPDLATRVVEWFATTLGR